MRLQAFSWWRRRGSNSTLWQRDISGDTCYKAAWLIKNALQNYDQAQYLGYWLLTDFLDEWLVPGGVFHGGYGLFTINGIPKAGYRQKLGEEGYRKACQEHALPDDFEEMEYLEFLNRRRTLMAQTVRAAYMRLCE